MTRWVGWSGVGSRATVYPIALPVVPWVIVFSAPHHTIGGMKRRCAWFIALMTLPGVACAQTQVALHLSYDTYAAGLSVAQVEAGFGLGPRTYQMNLAYHTTGMVGFLYRGHQLNTVSGSWRGQRPVPIQFFGEGVWRGERRVAQIDYDRGLPVVRQLVPPNENKREPVPDALRENAVDTLSALVELIHAVDATGRCEVAVRTYDGRRTTEIQASTAGEEVLDQTSRSSFSGRALRCDFVGHMLAGFKFGDDHERDSRPMHGSAWLAPATVGGPPVPVRMTFETRWFGDATMYLTGVGPGSELKAAAPAR